VVLVDSSVIVLQAKRDQFLERFIDPELAAVCPPIVMEILQGARNVPRARTFLANFQMIEAPVALERFEEAAELFRFLRTKSITIRRPMDCLIAAIAIHHGTRILHYDRDFEHIARHTSLQAVKVVI
jgi:predicted nucleic acid-binding protein